MAYVNTTIGVLSMEWHAGHFVFRRPRRALNAALAVTPIEIYRMLSAHHGTPEPDGLPQDLDYNIAFDRIPRSQMNVYSTRKWLREHGLINHKPPDVYKPGQAKRRSPCQE